ncbi:MAG: hypothetical protein ACR2PX_14015 [Endozoicomonas sp.]|uniref:hypothetical protein n=1 Tax=Endozoicomonas sp. TaxID=1892382 RepID=UPI003D9BD1CE
MEPFKDVIASAKISDRNFLCPAIIYLYNSERPEALIAFIEDKIKGLEDACSVPGSYLLHNWLHYTGQRLDASGCQPESRADILTRAYDYHQNQHFSVEESILKLDSAVFSV